MEKVLDWLLDDSNPAVRHRTLTELLEASIDDRQQAKDSLCRRLDSLKNADWQGHLKGLWLTYHLTALAECGLTRHDVNIETAVDRYLSADFDAGCGDALGLRALIMLGYGDDQRVARQLALLPETQLPDGGFLCLHRLNKLKYTPKSCYKDNSLMLMLFAECKKRNLPIPGAEALIGYFIRHNMFYRADGQTLVLESREGWRTIDAFYPFEVMRVGIQNIVEAMSALGYGHIREMKRAWAILESKKTDGGYVLDGTLTKSYLPKERVGQPSKWVTLYALLAHKHLVDVITER